MRLALTQRRTRAAIAAAVLVLAAFAGAAFSRARPCHGARIVAVVHDQPLILQLNDGRRYVNLDGQLAYPLGRTVTFCTATFKAEGRTEYSIDGADVELWDD